MRAERSGQLKSGDRIVAIAQAGGAFMDMNEVPLQNVVEAVRGQPNTMLQLKVISAGAAPNTPPRTVFIVRDQIKFKK
jgi:carboxyl-terminal processing protease